MKISFNFDSETRGFTLKPEDELEESILEEMSKRAEKGQSINLTRVTHVRAQSQESNFDPDSFQVIIRVNGGNGH